MKVWTFLKVLSALFLIISTIMLAEVSAWSSDGLIFSGNEVEIVPYQNITYNETITDTNHYFNFTANREYIADNAEVYFNTSGNYNVIGTNIGTAYAVALKNVGNEPNCNTGSWVNWTTWNASQYICINTSNHRIALIKTLSNASPSGYPHTFTWDWFDTHIDGVNYLDYMVVPEHTVITKATFNITGKNYQDWTSRTGTLGSIVGAGTTITRIGQLKYIGNLSIRKVGIYFTAAQTADGTAYLRVRDAKTDEILESATLGAPAGLTTYTEGTFVNNVTLNRFVYLSVELVGTTAGNLFFYEGSDTDDDVKYEESRWLYNGGWYTDGSSDDISYNITYTTTPYPKNPYIILNNTNYIFNTSGLYATTTELNLINVTRQLYSSCNFSGLYCYMPFLFHSDNLGIISISSMSFSNDGFIENSITYNTTVYETQEQAFTLNLTYDFNAYSTIAAYLNYNGTLYESTQNGTDSNRVFTVNIDTPVVELTKAVPIYWDVRMTNTSGINYFNSTRFNQTTYNLEFRECNSTVNATVLNFTVLDEQNYTAVNSQYEAFFEFYLGSGTIKSNYSYSNLSETTNNFRFCVYPSFFQNYTTLYVDMDSNYDAVGYADRNYYLRGAALTNVSNDINLYLLLDSVATKFFFEVRYGINVLADAVVTINKYFESDGLYHAVGSRKSDSSGEFTEYLELDKDYQFIVVKDGEALGSIQKSSICSVAPCEITLQLLASSSDIFGTYYNNFASSVTYTMNYSAATKSFYLTYIDTTGLAQYVRLEVTRTVSNQTTGNVLCNQVLYAPSGTLTCNMTGYTGDFVARAYISRSPEKIFSILSVGISDIAASLGLTGLLVVLFFFIITIMAFWADPQIGLASVPITLSVLRFMEFLVLSWPTIAAISLLCIYLIGKVNR